MVLPKRRPVSDAEVTRTSSHVPFESNIPSVELTFDGHILPTADDATDRR